MDFVKLGLKAADYIAENHFDKIPDEHFKKIPDEIFSPREALHNLHHGHQKHPNLGDVEVRSPPPSSTSQDEKSPTSAKSPDQHRRGSKQGYEDTNSEDGYEGDEEKSKENRRGDGSRSRRRSVREDPYYREAERRTRNPRDYGPEWPARDPSYPTQQRSPTSRTEGASYTQGHTPRRRSLHASAPAAAVECNEIPHYPVQQRFLPPSTTTPRGAPAPRYDLHYPSPAPNADQYYPSQQHRSPSLPPRHPPPSTTYATAAYVPYPYPSASAAAAAFGPERPYEYEQSQPYGNSPSRRSRSRHRSSQRHRHWKGRPGMTRRASSTGDHPDLDRPHSTQRSSQGKNRPGVRRRASSTGDVDSLNRSQGGRKRDFGLPSKLSSSDRALGAGSIGALAGGLIAQEVSSLMRKSGGKGGSVSRDNPMALTLIGAVVGGLGANLIAGKEERKQQVGERGSMRGWMDDVRGEKRDAVKGWKGGKDVNRDKSKDGERGSR